MPEQYDYLDLTQEEIAELKQLVKLSYSAKIVWAVIAGLATFITALWGILDHFHLFKH